ncbi:MAG TPA: hypothetical protein VMN38_09035 [Sphingomicrobium sp.]|nr:hypothetical protein [Sphingomicrobium sp.]
MSAPLAVLALFQTRKALQAQAVGNDLQTILSLWEKIDAHWNRFRLATTDPDRNFEFGQLAGYYELACGLFKDGILSTKATRTLEEHLDEILPRMLAHRDFKTRFDALKSSETTFENITWFCGPRLEEKRARAAKLGLRPSLNARAGQ